MVMLAVRSGRGLKSALFSTGVAKTVTDFTRKPLSFKTPSCVRRGKVNMVLTSTEAIRLIRDGAVLSLSVAALYTLAEMYTAQHLMAFLW